jgi:hypothetical protein
MPDEPCCSARNLGGVAIPNYSERSVVDTGPHEGILQTPDADTRVGTGLRGSDIGHRASGIGHRASATVGERSKIS